MVVAKPTVLVQDGAPAKLWNTRLFEWGVVCLVVLAALFGVGRQYRAMQAQAEFAAIESMLGSLRTALVLDYLHSSVQRGTATEAERVKNPMQLIQTPVRYAGPIGMSAQASVEPGSWLFDPACICVGYRPLNPQWLEPQMEFPVLWFRVRDAGGPYTLTPAQPYVWRGQSIR